MGRGKKRYRDYSSDEESSINKRLDRMEKIISEFISNDDHHDRYKRQDKSADRDHRRHHKSFRSRSPRRYYGSREPYDSEWSSRSRNYESDQSTPEGSVDRSTGKNSASGDPRATTSSDAVDNENNNIPATPADGNGAPVIQSVATANNSTSGAIETITPPAASDEPLEQAVLEKLGDRLKPDRVLLQAIHKDLAVRVEEIINKGLPAAERKTLLQKFPPPQNGLFMDPPKLNFEIKTNIPDSIVKRDDRIIEKQERITASLSGITKLMSMTLQLPQSEKLNMIEILGGVSRILADLQHEESGIRRSLILKNIDPSKRDILKSTSSGELLFGGELEEKFKAARLLESSSKKFKPGTQASSNSESKNSKGPSRRPSFRPQHNSTTRGPKSTSTSTQKSYQSQRSSRKSYSRTKK